MRFTWHRITTNQVISPNPANIGSVIVTPDGDDDRADVTLYDGESAQDPQILQIRTGAGTTDTINFQPYLQTQRGLYIEFGNHAEEVLVQLQWESE